MNKCRFKGLHIELFLGMPDECKSPFSINYGLDVIVHNATNSVWEENNRFEVMSGYETDVAIDRTRLIKLPSPYSDCILNTALINTISDSSDLVKDTLRITNSYTQQTCIQLCYQRFLTEKYRCFDSNLPHLNASDLQPCASVLESLTNSTFYDKVNERPIKLFHK